jgi:hypothetical protein
VIENVWAILKRKMAERAPRDISALEKMFIEE